MLPIINHNSYIIAALTILALAAALIATRFRQQPAAWIGLVALVLILVAGNLVFRVGPSEIETTAQFDQVLASGKPVVLEIYSNY